jgi:phage tail-like protein
MERFPPPVRKALGILSIALMVCSLFPAKAPADTFTPSGSAANPLSFRVVWDGRVIPEITKVNGLGRHTEVVLSRGGGDPNSPRRSPGLTGYEPILLERPLTGDPEFERWANKVWNFGSGLGIEASLRDYRKDIRIELFNALGQTVMAFRVYRCWPSDHLVMGEMDTGAPSLPIEILTLQHEGWERDHEIVAPH